MGDNCCSHVISNTPLWNKAIKNFLFFFMWKTPVLRPGRLPNTVGKVSRLHEFLYFIFRQEGLVAKWLDQCQENISVNEVNSVQNETVTGWKTCFRQYMKAILFQKKSSERTSSLKWKSLYHFHFLFESHQRSQPVSVQPVTTHSRSYEILGWRRNGEKWKCVTYQWPKCRFCFRLHAIICREVARLTGVICPH